MITDLLKTSNVRSSSMNLNLEYTSQTTNKYIMFDTSVLFAGVVLDESSSVLKGKDSVKLSNKLIR